MSRSKTLDAYRAMKLKALGEEVTSLTNQGALTGIVYLTQAEYDSLPASKLTDGKEYNIVEG